MWRVPSQRGSLLPNDASTEVLHKAHLGDVQIGAVQVDAVSSKVKGAVGVALPFAFVAFGVADICKMQRRCPPPFIFVRNLISPARHRGHALSVEKQIYTLFRSRRKHGLRNCSNNCMPILPPPDDG